MSDQMFTPTSDTDCNAKVATAYEQASSHLQAAANQIQTEIDHLTSHRDGIRLLARRYLQAAQALRGRQTRTRP